ncbi:RHO alpha subunit C-terminal catalytic domain-containing protein [Actinomycetota bacterium]
MAAETTPSEVGPLLPYLRQHRLDRAKVAHTEDLVEAGNWKLVMENNRECYHCDGHTELLSCYFPLFETSEEDITPRLRPMYERFTTATADLAAACERQPAPRDLLIDQRERPTGYRIERAALDGAGESFGPGGRSVSRRLLGDFDTARMGDLSLHMQPNAWFHFLADHAVVFSVVPLAADRALVRTIWLVHEDAIEGEDYDLGELTAVWQATNAQDGAFVARTQQGVSDPAYLPGPYSPTETAVEDFVTWYVNRLAAHGAGR